MAARTAFLLILLPALAACAADLRSPAGWGVDVAKLDRLEAVGPVRPLTVIERDRLEAKARANQRLMDALWLDRVLLREARLDAAMRRGRCAVEGCEASVAPMSVLSFTALERERAGFRD